MKIRACRATAKGDLTNSRSCSPDCDGRHRIETFFQPDRFDAKPITVTSRGTVLNWARWARYGLLGDTDGLETQPRRMRAIRRLRPNEFGVVVYGNPTTSKQRAAELALLRAAHLTREQDRSHFTVVG